MNNVSLIDSADEECSMKLKNTMKAFNISLDYSSSDITEIRNLQTIMEKGNVQDFAKCIENVLNYHLSSLTNYSHVKILDPSFVALFHIGQFIIKFLLFWKTKLFEENFELHSRLREQEKIHQDYLRKKLEVRDLRKQLASHSQLNQSSVAECSRCSKIFVNDSYLYAHYKRRHGDEAFSTNGTNIHLYDELQTLNQRMIDIMRKNHRDFTRTPASKSMKMKLAPEADCLETQEKYWKGKLKELYDKHVETEQKMKNALDELKIENAVLNKEIDSCARIRGGKSVGIQTESSSSLDDFKNFLPTKIGKRCSSLSSINVGHDSLLPPTCLNVYPVDSICQRNSTPEFSTSTFRRWSIDSAAKSQSSLSKENDIVDQVNSFLAHYNHKEKIEEGKYFTSNDMLGREEDRKVIAKCFTSEELVNKLVGIYEKRSSLPIKDKNSRVSDLFDSDTKPSSSSEIVQNEIQETTTSSEKKCGTMKESNAAQIDIHAKKSPNANGFVSFSSTKPRTGVFPFLRNIPSKLMKNYTKSRKKCVDVIEDNIVNRFTFQSSNQSKEDLSIVKPCHQVDTLCQQKTETQSESEPSCKDLELRTQSDVTNHNSELKLISALKKSKSTGNLVKKVIFADESPTVRNNFNGSESNFSEFLLAKTPQPGSTFTVVDVHHSGFFMPVPAPRAKKNISSATSIN